MLETDYKQERVQDDSDTFFRMEGLGACLIHRTVQTKLAVSILIREKTEVFTRKS